MSTYRQMYKDLLNGNLDNLAKELVKFGDIVKDKSFDISYGFYMGAHRVTTFAMVGHVWTVRKHNGNVVSINVEH